MLNNLSTGKFILSFNQSFSIILLMSSISFSDNFSCLPNAEINAGREPSNVFSTILTISASCICSFETMEETIVFSFFITPLSDNLYITVYVVVLFQPNFFLQSFTKLPLIMGSFSHNIRQNLYSLSKTLGVSIILFLSL